MNEFEPRVALVRPATRILREPLNSEPLTQEILAASLRSSGIENVAILDEMAREELTLDSLSYFNVVCVSADTPSYPRAKMIKQMCDQVKASGSGEIKTIIGGAHASALPEKVLSDGWDVVCKGEGDLVIGEIILKNQSGLVQGSRVTDLDAIPYPARDLVDTQIYGLERGELNRPTASILTSRGCPYSCIYCYKGVFGNRVYYRSIDNVIGELREIQEKGVNQLAIFDDTFTLRAERTIQLSEKMSDLKMKWTCNARVNTVTLPMLKSMKAAGCSKISFGLESADLTVLKMINKGISLDQAKKAIELSKSAGIHSRLYLIFGFWEDSEASIDATLKFLYETQPGEVQVSLLIPLPGSQLYNDAAKYEISLTDDLEQYYYVGVGGPHSFINHTKYLNSDQYQLAVERYKREIEQWRAQRKTFAL